MESREAKEKREEERRKKREAEMKEGGVLYVNGNLYSLVQRMCNEYRTSLQNIDAHTPDYVVRLKDESLLIDLVEKAQNYYIDVAQKPIFARQVVMLRLNLLYYHYGTFEFSQPLMPAILLLTPRTFCVPVIFRSQK